MPKRQSRGLVAEAGDDSVSTLRFKPVAPAPVLLHDVFAANLFKLHYAQLAISAVPQILEDVLRVGLKTKGDWRSSRCRVENPNYDSVKPRQNTATPAPAIRER